MRRSLRASGRRPQRVFGAVAVVLALGIGVAGVQTATATTAAIQLAEQPPLDPSMMAESIQFLTSEYGISETEALRRLDLQRTSALLEEELASRYPDNYGGMWIDQERGGQLMIASTDPAGLEPALRDLPDSENMQVTEVVHSRADLKAAVDSIMTSEGRVERQVTSSGEPTISFDVIATVDDTRNAVLVTGPHAASYSADSIERAHDLPAGMVVVDPSWEQITDDYCSINYCDPPMRGGLKLELYKSLSGGYTGYCTNGFNVKGSNGWQWTVTAGHCIKDAAYSKHNGKWVGYRNWATYVSNYYPYDGAIMPYVVTGGTNYATYWLSGQPKNRVFAAGKSSLYPIYGMYTYDQIKVGWAACHTGAGYGGTRCGTVKGKDGGIRMSFLTQGGDSGGPLYSQVDQRAYAILKGHTSTYSYYSPLSVIFYWAWDYSNISFAVNTA